MKTTIDFNNDRLIGKKELKKTGPLLGFDHRKA